MSKSMQGDADIAVGEPPVCDPRVARSRAVVLAACAELLTEVGFGGVTIEAVSARSGVAKTTIYRQWSSRAALTIDAFRAMGMPGPAPDLGSVEADLTQILTTLADELMHAPWSKALASLSDAAARDPELARLHAQFSLECRQPLVQVLERARRRGELGDQLSPQVVCAALAGPLFFRRFVSQEALDEGFVNGVLAVVLDGIRVDQPTPEPRT